MTRIDLDVVRSSILLVLDRIEASMGDRVDVEGDLYWSLDPVAMTNPYAEPDSPTLGSLSDCMEYLQGIVEDPDSVISYHLVWLGDVLRMLGVTVPSEVLYREE